MIGPRNPVSQLEHARKYRQKGESFDDYTVRYARTLADPGDDKHFRDLLEGVRTQAILPAGRQQRAVGWPFVTTAFNCFVGDEIPDDTKGIGDALTESMLTLRSGGGCGWDFSTLRPEKEPVRKLGDDAYASGPVSFMGMWHAMCNVIRSAGERRGAMMAVLRVDHPDIMTFIRAKQDQVSLTTFNISVGITDEFMEAVENDGLYWLQFEGRRFRQVRALDVWACIMENNWDWAEPGVIFLDVINRMNPLGYCEKISASNPCAEQPLPPKGACLLLSHNLVKYLTARGIGAAQRYEIDLEKLAYDVSVSVRACDNLFERTVYPLESYKKEAFAKRRMGVGVTGVANAIEVCGFRYGTHDYRILQRTILSTIMEAAYTTSIELAKVKGSFPLFDADKWLSSGFAQNLPDEIRWGIKKHGLRNGLLLSIAPTGTISLTADNVSSGIEPPPAIEARRKVRTGEGFVYYDLNDYAFEEYGIRCRTALDCTPQEHVAVLCDAQTYVDSAISKTINFRGAKPDSDDPRDISFDDFRDIYRTVYKGGGKGCSTYNVNGKRRGIIEERKPEAGIETVVEDSCRVDAETGARTCG